MWFRRRLVEWHPIANAENLRRELLDDRAV